MVEQPVIFPVGVRVLPGAFKDPDFVNLFLRWCGVIDSCAVIWVVVSNIVYFQPYLGKWSNLTNMFQMGWNHQLVMFDEIEDVKMASMISRKQSAFGQCDHKWTSARCFFRNCFAESQFYHRCTTFLYTQLLVLWGSDCSCKVERWQSGNRPWQKEVSRFVFASSSLRS